jgi:hypothetical protein
MVLTQAIGLIRPALSVALMLLVIQPVSAANDAERLRDYVRSAYPSLLYVESYRQSFPNEQQGTKPFWSAGESLPDRLQPRDLVAALAELQDPHVSLTGRSAGKTETLGVLFRTASDGTVVVWRVFDLPKRDVTAGEHLISIDGFPARLWLERAAAMTFGGTRRGRYAEAALDLGLGTPVVHRIAHLGETARLTLDTVTGHRHVVTLAFEPMTAKRAFALTAAIRTPDLPEIIGTAGGRRIGTLRIGAFAPQYDPLFLDASRRAGEKPGATDDQAMLAGYCAVTSAFIRHYDSIAQRSNVMVLDLRGNLGGFDREARLQANAIAPEIPARTFDWFATRTAGISRLTEQVVDPSCGHVTVRRPIIVLVDAGTRSSGELMTAWLWTAGTIVAGETTAGADGGLDSDATGFPLPSTGFNVRLTANFTVFDPAVQLSEGDWPERTLVARTTADHFRLSRNRPFVFQSLGFRADVPTSTTLSDLQDGGLAEVRRIIASLPR